MELSKVTEPLEALGAPRKVSAIISISIVAVVVAFNLGGLWAILKQKANEERSRIVLDARRDSVMSVIIANQEYEQFQKALILSWLSDFSSASEYAFNNTIDIVREMAKPDPNYKYIDRVVLNVQEQTELYYPHYKLARDTTMRKYIIGARPIKKPGK